MHLANCIALYTACVEIICSTDHLFVTGVVSIVWPMLGLHTPRHDPDPELIPTFLLVDPEMIPKELENGN